MYAVVDIETTGGSYLHDKITEIAIYVHDGEKVTSEFSTLINPERYIPNYITAMTGISNEMVAAAPKFFEVAKQIVEITDGKIFVAHNASFDYNFVRNEYKRLGYDFVRKQLCTVKLSRKTIPGKQSYSLGRLCQELGIRIENRHRAAGDALATVKLLELILDLNGKELPISFNDRYSFKDLNETVNTALIGKLPEETGIYYFHNEKGDIIYIGKSTNIKKRVITHLNNTKLKKALELKKSLFDISCELTGSELIALLKESEEIKNHRPLFNRSQRRISFDYGLYINENPSGYMCLNVSKNSGNNVPVTTFSDSAEAGRFMFDATERYNLCQKLNGIYQTGSACFQYSINQCQGACIEKEPAEQYNSRVKELIESCRIKFDNILLFDKGRNEGERAVVLVENGKYCGYGYIDCDSISNDLEIIKDCIKYFRDNRDVQSIIRNYLRKHRVEKIIRF